MAFSFFSNCLHISLSELYEILDNKFKNVKSLETETKSFEKSLELKSKLIEKITVALDA